MRDYSKNKAKAGASIKKNGAPITFTLKAADAAGYDDFGNEIDPADEDEVVEGYGIKLNYEPKDYSGNSADSRNIQHGDCKLIFWCETGQLKVGMIGEIDGEKWRVINPNPLQPAGLVIMYEAQLRR